MRINQLLRQRHQLLECHLFPPHTIDTHFKARIESILAYQERAIDVNETPGEPMEGLAIDAVRIVKAGSIRYALSKRS
jgi:hypothetical protein